MRNDGDDEYCDDNNIGGNSSGGDGSGEVKGGSRGKV